MFTRTTARNRIAAAALAGLGAAAAFAAPAVAAVVDSGPGMTVLAAPTNPAPPPAPTTAKAPDDLTPQRGVGCPKWVCGSTGNHNEVLTRSAR